MLNSKFKIMRKNILFTLLLAAGMGLFSSCEKMFGDYLDKQPSNELTEEQVFSSFTNLEAFHYDTYNFLRNGIARINNSWMDAATDLATTSFSSGGTRTSFNIGNYYAASGAPEIRDTWEHYFRGIRKCNTLLQRIDAVPGDPGKTPEINAANVVRMKAESRFLRAYFFWELCLRYGALPIIEEPLDPENPTINDLPRPSSEKECFQYILKELEESYAGLDVTVENNDLGRITKPVSLALQSRIKLYLASPRYSNLGLATWQDAANAALLFINNFGNGSPFKLVTESGDPTTAYSRALYQPSFDGNKEVIFWRNDAPNQWWINESPVGYGGGGGLSPSQNLVDMYDMANGTSPFASYDNTGAPVYTAGNGVSVNPASGYDDQKPYENRDPRFYGTILYNGAIWWNRPIETIVGGTDNPIGNANATPTGYYNKKYHSDQSDHSFNDVKPWNRNWIFIRYAEILLNYAEALNEAGGPGDEVFNALQQLRDRVGMTALLKNRADLQDKDALRKFIHKERTVELAFEDHRSWDVRRWNVAKEALSRPIYGMVITGSGSNLTYTRKVVQTRVFEDKMYLYPIPEEEIWKTGIKNNPEW